MSGRFIKCCLSLSLTALLVPPAHAGGRTPKFLRSFERAIRPLEHAVVHAIAGVSGSSPASPKAPVSAPVEPPDVVLQPQTLIFLGCEFPCPPLLTRQHEYLLRVITERNLYERYVGEEWLSKLLDPPADDLIIAMAMSKMDGDGYHLSTKYFSAPLPYDLVVYVPRVKESLLKFVAEADPRLALMYTPVIARVNALRLEEGTSFTLDQLSSTEAILADAISDLGVFGYVCPPFGG